MKQTTKKPKFIILHCNPDLDACACAALLGVRPEEVHFIPADLKILPEKCPCCGEKIPSNPIILDHRLGLKGKAGHNGETHAAVNSLPEAILSDPTLIQEIDEQDKTGRSSPNFNLSQILEAVRADLKNNGMYNADGSYKLDRAIVAAMGRVIRGLNLIYKQKQVARKAAQGIRFEKVDGYSFAIVPKDQGRNQLYTILRDEYGANGLIYCDGYNLGVHRFPGEVEPDFRLLKDKLPGWFIHSSGFLAAWGTNKAPKHTFPPAGTPQNLDELLTLMREVFE